MVAELSIDGGDIFTLQNVQLFMLMYADDTVLFSLSAVGLQSMLNKLSVYCNNAGINVNIDKTKAIIFEKRISVDNTQWIYNNSILEIVDHFVYLGLDLYKNGRWNKTQQRASSQGRNALFRLFSIMDDTVLPVSKQCFVS